MDTVYPAAASALCRGRRRPRPGPTATGLPRVRPRTTPVTFAEIKEVDEEVSEAEACEEPCSNPGPSKRRPDVLGLEERLGRQFAEFRRRRHTRRDVLRESDHEAPPAPPPARDRELARTGSVPDALHRDQTTDI